METYKAFEMADQILEFDSLPQAYTNFFAILETHFEPQTFKAIASAFKKHLYAMEARRTESNGPVLVIYDGRRRKEWFKELKLSEDNATPDNLASLPPLPPWDDQLFHSCCQQFGKTSAEVLDITKLGDSHVKRLIQFTSMVVNDEKDKKKTGLAVSAVGEVVEEVLSIASERLASGTWSPLNYSSSLLRPAERALIAPRTTTLPSRPHSSSQKQQPPPYPSGSLPNLHPSKGLVRPSAVDVLNSRNPNDLCGFCGASGDHVWNTCVTYNPGMLTRNGGSFVLVTGSGKLCHNFQLGYCNGCSYYEHACARCGDRSGSHGFFRCPRNSGTSAIARTSGGQADAKKRKLEDAKGAAAPQQKIWVLDDKASTESLFRI